MTVTGCNHEIYEIYGHDYDFKSFILLLSINYLLHSDFDCDSDFIENPLVVRVDLPSGQVEAELEGDEDAELGGQQLPLAHTKHGLDLLQKKPPWSDILETDLVNLI